MATVKGDVHDIGKNIVGVVLGCNNFKARLPPVHLHACFSPILHWQACLMCTTVAWMPC